jgi:hypothetical protein
MKYPQIKMGTFTVTSGEGSGGKIINLGFVPEYVLLRNVTAATQYELFDTETDAYGLQHKAASTYHVFLTSGGLSMVDTVTIDTGNPVRKTKVQGFSVPAAAIAQNDVCHWMAIRAS